MTLQSIGQLTLFYFISLLFFPSTLVIGQTILEPTWVKEEPMNEGELAEGWGVDVDDAGNIYWPINVNKGSQGLDIICYKYDEEGNELWTNPLVFGGTGSQQSYVCNAKTDFLYIGGRNCDFGITTCDMLLLKVNSSNGELIWDRTQNFAGDGYDELDGLEILGNQIFCGGWAHELESGTFNGDIGLWQLDTDGNTNWTNAHGQVGSAEHQDGHFVVDDDFIYGAGLWNGTGAANLYNGYYFLGKFSKQDGSLVDSTLFGYQSDAFLDIENALGMTSDGTYLYITGYTTPNFANDWQIFLAKYDKNLNQIWKTNWGKEGTETARGIVVNNGKIFIAGSTESNSISAGKEDGLLLIYDTDGNFMAYQTWGAEQNDSFRDITFHKNSIYLSGTSLEGLTMSSAFLLKVDDLITSTQEINSNDLIEISTYPNPSKGSIHISLSSPIQGYFSIIDFYGNILVKEKINRGMSTFNYNFESKGIYFLSLQNGNNILSKKVINLN